MEDNILERRAGESGFQHHKRLIYGKLVDKTLSDYDFSELSGYVYGKEYSCDVARRMMYGSRSTIELMENDTAASDVCCAQDDIDSRLVELQKERQRLSDQRREYNKGIASDARFEHLCDVVRTCAHQMQDLDCMINPDTSCENMYLSDSEAVVVFSDWHAGMVTDNIFNTYNMDVCKRRVNRVVEEAMRRIRLHGCNRLHVVVLGDLIHGNCHVSARVASEEVAVEQLMHATELLAQAIYSLSQNVVETYVYVTYGNHARAVPNKSESIHRDNWERVSEWWLKERFSNIDNINVASSNTNEFLLLNVCGHDICASHGDLDTIKSSPNLYATLFNKQYGKNIEYILLGDKHHHESFEEFGITAMICGSLCGVDDYANEHRLYSEPSQLLLIVTPEDGVDAEYKIKCK